MAKNDVELKGNLTRDPHFDYLDGRDGPVPFMRFTLAVDRHPPRQQGTDYLQVVSYGQSALHDHAYLRQGSEVFVEGWVRTRNGTDASGNPATRIEVVAEGRYVDPDGGIADTMCSRHGLSQKAATDLFESIVSMEVIARKQA